MKSKLPAKILIAVCLCLITALTFTACKDKDIFADSSDFESYPEYWNNFNDEIFVPDKNNGLSSTTSSEDNTNSSESETSSEEDWTANLTVSDDDTTTSNTVDTDKDGIPDNVDPDDETMA